MTNKLGRRTTNVRKQKHTNTPIIHHAFSGLNLDAHVEGMFTNSVGGVPPLSVSNKIKTYSNLSNLELLHIFVLFKLKTMRPTCNFDSFIHTYI